MSYLESKTTKERRKGPKLGGAGCWWDATVLVVHDDDTVDVQYSDGAREDRVMPEYVSATAELATLVPPQKCHKRVTQAPRSQASTDDTSQASIVVCDACKEKRPEDLMILRSNCWVCKDGVEDGAMVYTRVLPALEPASSL